MKVAMIGLRGLDDGLGGVEKVVRELSTRLVRQDIDVTCYCRAAYNNKESYHGVKLINSPTLYGKHSETALYAIGAMNHALRQDYDIIHLHALASSSLAWIPRLFKRKTVVSIHGLDWQRAKWGWGARKLLQCGEMVAARYSDGATCVSESLTTYFKMRYLGKRFWYLPNGCDLNDQIVVSPTTDQQHWLYMGRLTPEKGVHRLIQAYRGLSTQRDLVIAGPADHNEAYKRYLLEIADGDPRIHFPGRVMGEQKACLLNDAYAFVLPSEIEGFPVALLEAAGLGKCSLFSRIPTMVEVLGTYQQDYPFSFNPYQVDEIQAVMQLAENQPDQMKQWSAKLKKRVQDAYNWDRIAIQLSDIYHQVAGEGESK